MSLNVAQLYAENEADRYEMHTRHLNEQMVRVLRTIGYDVGFVAGEVDVGTPAVPAGVGVEWLGVFVGVGPCDDEPQPTSNPNNAAAPRPLHALIFPRPAMRFPPTRRGGCPRAHTRTAAGDSAP